MSSRARLRHFNASVCHRISPASVARKWLMCTEHIGEDAPLRLDNKVRHSVAAQTTQLAESVGENHLLALCIVTDKAVCLAATHSHPERARWHPPLQSRSEALSASYIPSLGEPSTLTLLLFSLPALWRACMVCEQHL